VEEDVILTRVVAPVRVLALESAGEGDDCHLAGGLYTIGERTR
jgi:hypothetical protein